MIKRAVRLRWGLPVACLVAVGGAWLAISLPPAGNERPAVLQELPAARVAAGHGPTHAPDLSDIQARPLFFRSRRPAGAVETGPAAESMPVLVGTVLMGSRRVALLRARAGAPVQRIGEGQSFETWTVARIEADRAELINGAQRHELAIDWRRAQPTDGRSPEPKDNAQ